MTIATNHRILILEPFSSARIAEEAAVLGAGFTPEFVTETAAALELARFLRPRAVLATVFPPHFQGLRLCRQLRADPATSDIPVFITSLIDLAHLADETGAAGFFLKPLQPEVLTRSLKALRHAPQPAGGS